MSYQPLARKYRPKSFAELVGQEAASLAIANGIKLKREPRAVIFAGVRGIGKTTTARLYAKALNCEQGPTPEPCNECDSCQAITAGIHEDVLEIDGASNTSVDDVRALKETVNYVPQRSRFRIYIIDEVHMLSQSAFNALLKTLEEPPAHVVFMLATTELHKVPQTIVGRCQTFHLQKIQTKAIAEKLKTLVSAEGLSADERALALIAREGHGSMRDAITLLDQAIALGGGSVTMESVACVVTDTSSTLYLQMIDALLQRDGKGLWKVVEELDQAGVSFIMAAERVAELCRHGFVIRSLGVDTLDINQLGLDDAELSMLQELSTKSDAFDLNRIFRSFVRCRKELDGSALDRFVFENYALEWCFDPGLPLLHDLMEGRKESASPAPRAGASSAPDSKRVVESAPAAPPGPPRNLMAVFAETKKEASNPSPAAAPTIEKQQASSMPRAVEQQPPAKAPWPASWRALVEILKEEKPLQARVFEETYVLAYGPNEVKIAVEESSMAGAKLLQKETQDKLRENLFDLFDFRGSLQVVKRAVGASATDENLAAAPESLLDTRKREQKEREQATLDSAANDPITRAVIETFEGVIERVELVPQK